MTCSKIAKMCDYKVEQVKEIIEDRQVIEDSYKYKTSKSSDIMLRRQKIAFLGECMYEYIQRAQYHANAYLDKDILLYKAAKFCELLKIQNFIADSSWLNQFKIAYNIPLSQRQIVLKRTPPSSLVPRKIIWYCRRLQLKKVKKSKDSQASNTKELMTNPAITTTEDELRMLRQHKIQTLEKALFEYIQRSQYHEEMPLKENLQIRVACKLKNILKIENFLPNKKWLNHFKLHYNIRTSQRMIVVDRIPPSSLNLKDILSYCGRTYRKYVNTQKEIEGQQIITELKDQAKSVVTLDTNGIVEEDIKPNIMDIKIELPEVQEQAQSSYSTGTQEEEEEEEVHPAPLKIQNIVSLQMEESSDDEVLPKLTKSYADALKMLKSLEDFSLLEENYLAISLITHLENIFKNPPPSKLN